MGPRIHRERATVELLDERATVELHAHAGEIGATGVARAEDDVRDERRRLVGPARAVFADGSRASLGGALEEARARLEQTPFVAARLPVRRRVDARLLDCAAASRGTRRMTPRRRRIGADASEALGLVIFRPAASNRYEGEHDGPRERAPGFVVERPAAPRGRSGADDADGATSDGSTSRGATSSETSVPSEEGSGPLAVRSPPVATVASGGATSDGSTPPTGALRAARSTANASPPTSRAPPIASAIRRRLETAGALGFSGTGGGGGDDATAAAFEEPAAPSDRSTRAKRSSAISSAPPATRSSHRATSAGGAGGTASWSASSIARAVGGRSWTRGDRARVTSASNAGGTSARHVLGGGAATPESRSATFGPSGVTKRERRVKNSQSTTPTA